MSNYRFSDQDIEILISGDTPEDERLARLVSLIEKLHDEYERVPSEERVNQVAAAAAEIAVSSKPDEGIQPVPVRTMSRPRRFAVGLRRKLATALAAAVLLGGMTGVAFAADEAAPGDPLYGLDRALENIGIGDGGLPERFAEAGTLNTKGHPADALAHAAEAIAQAGADDVDTEEALSGLQEAIDALNREDFPVEQAADAVPVLENVAEMLTWMQENADLIGNTDFTENENEPGAFGKAVAEMAKGISPESEATDAADAAEDAAEREAEEAEDDNGPPEDIPGPPDSVPPNSP